MARQLKRSTLAAVVFFAVALAACSSGAKHGAGTTTTSSAPQQPYKSTTNWNLAAAHSLLNVSNQIKRAVKGECADITFLPRDQYVVNAQRLGLAPPLAVSDCTIAGNQIELNAFKSNAVRDKFDNDRTNALCSVSKKAQVPIAGLHFVLVGTASIQATGEGDGRQIADAVHGQYRGIACPGAVLDWEAAAEARINNFAAKLRARQLECADFEFVDRATYARNPQYANRLPAAYARCNGPGGAVIWIAAFSPKSATRDKFVDGETRLLCNSQPGVVAVRGPDWALLVADQHDAAIAAAALGGKAGAPAC